MQLIAKDFMAVAAAAAVALHPSYCVLSPVLPAAGPLAGRCKNPQQQQLPIAAAAAAGATAMLKCCSFQGDGDGDGWGWEWGNRVPMDWRGVKCLLRLPCCHRRCRCPGTGALLWQNTSPHQQQQQQQQCHLQQQQQQQ